MLEGLKRFLGLKAREPAEKELARNIQGLRAEYEKGVLNQTEFEAALQKLMEEQKQGKERPATAAVPEDPLRKVVQERLQEATLALEPKQPLQGRDTGIRPPVMNSGNPALVKLFQEWDSFRVPEELSQQEKKEALREIQRKMEALRDAFREEWMAEEEYAARLQTARYWVSCVKSARLR